MSLWQRLAHRLFGWHYICFTFGDHVFVCRVRRAPTGEIYVPFLDYLFFLTPDGQMTAIQDREARPYKPLTWRLPEQQQSSLRVVK